MTSGDVLPSGAASKGHGELQLLVEHINISIGISIWINNTKEYYTKTTVCITRLGKDPVA